MGSALVYERKIRCRPPPPLICRNKSLLVAMLVTNYQSVNGIIGIFCTCHFKKLNLSAAADRGAATATELRSAQACLTR